jgi:hypothetical protein
MGAVIRARSSEDIANSEELVRAIVNCGVVELAVVLQLIYLWFNKNPLYPITNP